MGPDGLRARYAGTAPGVGWARRLLGILILALVVAAPPDAHAGTIRVFGLDYAGIFGEFDPSIPAIVDGAATGLVEMNAGAVGPAGGLWASGGTVGANLVSIDPDTFAVTTGPSIDLGADTVSIRGMAFSPGGTLYASNLDGCFPTGCPPGTQDLWTIDLITGVGALVGNLGGGFQGLAFDSAGVLYGWDTSGSGLVTIDPVTAAVTDVNPSLGDDPPIQGLDFAPDGTLWAVGFNALSGGSALYTIDPATANASLIFQDPLGFLDMRAVFVIPEPTALSLLGAGTLLLALRRRRRPPARGA